jgi:hypothetical protein
MPPRRIAQRLLEEAAKKTRRPWDRIRPALLTNRALLAATGAASLDRLWTSRQEAPFLLKEGESVLGRAFSERFPDSVAQVLSKADRTLRHEFELLGSGRVTFDRRLPWRSDFKTGREIYRERIPHQGSGFASLLKRVPFASQQSEDLDPNSQFLHALGVAWGQAKADRRVLTRYVVATDDAIVGPVSAMGSWSPDYQVVSGVGHRAIVKPETADSTSFLVAKTFLLEDPIQPGGVEADYRAPLLRFNHVEPGRSTRFIYSARMLPFLGRDAEINILGDFLGSPGQPFRWTVMHGSGGVGKSRLALELCLAVRNEWHAGFLPRDGQEPDWGRWQPQLPTLIVIDYAARDTDRVGPIVRALAGRGVADGTLRLAAPVRILLVERTGEGDWLDKIVGVGTTKAQVNTDRTPNLQLATISDPWPIFEFIFQCDPTQRLRVRSAISGGAMSFGSNEFARIHSEPIPKPRKSSPFRSNSYPFTGFGIGS